MKFKLWTKHHIKFGIGSSSVVILFLFLHFVCRVSPELQGFASPFFAAQSVERLLVKSCRTINLSSARLPSPRFAFIGVPTFDISIPLKTTSHPKSHPCPSGRRPFVSLVFVSHPYPFHSLNLSYHSTSLSNSISSSFTSPDLSESPDVVNLANLD